MKILAFALTLLVAGAARADGQVLKIASLAPEGSAWMKLFGEWRDAIDKRTGGQVKIKFYAGGVAGDERDVVRKMRLGQMSGAAVTAVGLGLIQPDVRVLEIPFLFRNESELDQVRTALDGEFRKKFEDKGYELLSWGDVGPVRLFTNVPLKEKADLAKIKMWVWTDDPLSAKLFQRLGITAVPLGVPDVLPGLQTGLINACNGSPLAAVALQWHSKVKYTTSMVLSYSIGAVVLARKQWDGLTDDQRKIINAESHTLSEGLTKLVRTDNDLALKKMQSQGVELVPTPPALEAVFRSEGKAATLEMDGKLYGKDFRTRVEQLLAGRRP